MQNNQKIKLKRNSLVLMILIGGLIIAPFIFPFEATAKTPVVSTNLAFALSKSSIQLNGFFDPSGSTPPSTYWFEWGRTNSLGNLTYSNTVHTKFSRSISARIDLPDPASLYYFRAVARNAEGINYGQILTFQIPRESIIPAPVINPQQGINQTNTGQSPAPPSPTQETVAAPASYPILVKQKITNLSFPNGTKIVTSGKAGDIFEFLITLENTSAKTIYNLTIKNKMSIFLEFLGASESHKYNKAENEVFWEIPELLPNKTINFKINVGGKEFSENIVIENYTKITNKDFTLDSEKTMILLNISPLRFIFKTRSEKIFAGGINEYEIYYKNESEVPLKNASLQIFLPPEIKFQESDRKFSQKDNNLTLKIGEIKPDQEDFIRLTAIVSEMAKNKKSLVTLAVINYQENFSTEKETLSASVENIIDPKLANLMAAALGLQQSLSPTFLNLSLISIILILLIFCLYYYNLYRKQEKRILSLEEKIEDLEQQLDEIPEERKIEQENLARN